MKIIFIDMDDTLCDYESQFERFKNNYPEVKFPQSIAGFFETMKPLDNALTVAQALFERNGFMVYILTAPSIYNPLCYTEKRNWVESFLGFKWVERLIIANDKSLLKGHFLIDDKLEGRGQDGFEGDLLHFGSDELPDWRSVAKYFNIS